MGSQNGNHKTREIEPLKGIELAPQPKRLVAAIKVYRVAIDRAISLAALPHIGGRRHMRLPLSYFEQEHHAKVDRYLARRRREA